MGKLMELIDGIFGNSLHVKHNNQEGNEGNRNSFIGKGGCESCRYTGSAVMAGTSSYFFYKLYNDKLPSYTSYHKLLYRIFLTSCGSGMYNYIYSTRILGFLSSARR